MRVSKHTEMTNQRQASTASAREFAVSAHGSQKYGDEPYSVHLDAVTRTLGELGFSGDELQIIAMLHDVLEDTKVSATQIGEQFGSRVLESVEQLTRQNTAPLLYFGTMDERAFAVKLADRLSNVRALGGAGVGFADKHRRLLQEYRGDMVFVTNRASAFDDRYAKAVVLLEEALTAAAIRVGVDQPDQAVLPKYFIVGDRPVKSVPTNEGGLDVLAYDWNSGEFIRAMEYLAKISFGEGEVERVTRAEFDDRVEKLRLGGDLMDA